jgi:hypothetical protein
LAPIRRGKKTGVVEGGSELGKNGIMKTSKLFKREGRGIRKGNR